MPGIRSTMPSIPDPGRACPLAGTGPSRLRRSEPAGAVSAHAGNGPKRAGRDLEDAASACAVALLRLMQQAGQMFH